MCTINLSARRRAREESNYNADATSARLSTTRTPAAANSFSADSIVPGMLTPLQQSLMMTTSYPNLLASSAVYFTQKSYASPMTTTRVTFSALRYSSSPVSLLLSFSKNALYESTSTLYPLRTTMTRDGKDRSA